MSVWTLLLLLAFVAMIAMHLRGGAGHGHRRDEGHDQGRDASAPEARDAGDARQSAGTTESHSGHGTHRHGC